MKYIVYLTVNTYNNKIYIGVHKTEDSNIFDGYIGCGANINNAHSYNRAKSPFHYAILKYGTKSFNRITLKEFNTYDEALAFEALLVDEKFVKRNDTYNVSLGGGMPPVTNKVVYQYSLEGKFLREFPSIENAESILNYSGKGISTAIKNKTTCINSLWADFKVDKLDISGYSVYNVKKDVYQYNFNGLLINKYESITDAAKALNTTTSNILRAIKGGYKIIGTYLSYENVQKFKEKDKISVRNTNIHQYNLNGTYVTSYNTIQDVVNIFGSGATSGVLSSIRLGRAYKNYQWSIDKLDSMKELIPDKAKVRPVGRYSLDGELLESFRTTTECKNKYGQGIFRNLKQQTETCKGFIFKYL